MPRRLAAEAAVGEAARDPMEDCDGRRGMETPRPLRYRAPPRPAVAGAAAERARSHARAARLARWLAVPLLGDAADVPWKANRRNLTILQDHPLRSAATPTKRAWRPQP